MSISKNNVALLCFIWAFFLVLGHVGINIPTGLMVLGSILTLIV